MTQENLSYALRVSEKKRYQAAQQMKQHKVKIDRIKKKMVSQNQYGSFFDSDLSEPTNGLKSRNLQQSDTQQVSSMEKPMFPQMPQSIFSSFSNVNITRAIESNFTFKDQRAGNLESQSITHDHKDVATSSSPYRDTKHTHFT